MKDELPNRQSIRLKGWNYAAGWYFVTINTQGSRALFGAIAGGRVILNELGRLAETCWLDIPLHFPEVQLDEFVVMPRQFNALLTRASSCCSLPLTTQSTPPAFVALLGAMNMCWLTATVWS